METRTNGEDALACFRDDPEGFDLVITDMTMPHMRGDELSRRMLALRPDLPVILCTGYSKRISDDKAGKIGVRSLLMKPLSARDLLITVRTVLDGK
ncbi:MAG: response regulator [Deltaproteobacteria bacterium]|nr:response regulator [Deltaproteobacteria bacterium]